MSDLYLIAEKITEIKDTVDKTANDVTHIKTEQAVHNHILNEHHKRSIMLEESIKPIQMHVNLVQKVLYFFGAILLAVSTQWAVHLFTK